MFNIQPGQGVGFVSSKEIALGLGTSFIAIEEVLTTIAELIFRRTSITNTFRRVEVDKIFRREDVCS